MVGGAHFRFLRGFPWTGSWALGWGRGPSSNHKVFFQEPGAESVQGGQEPGEGGLMLSRTGQTGFFTFIVLCGSNSLLLCIPA